MRSLLDVNVLISLMDPDHVHHAHGWEWLGRHASSGWASCPFTQNGCIRILSQPSYPNSFPASVVMARLARATRNRGHEFWPADLSIMDEELVSRERIHGPGQVTDVYLLALAVRRGGRLVTLDKQIPLNAVRGASGSHLVVL